MTPPRSVRPTDRPTVARPTVRGGGIKPLFCLTSDLTSLIKKKVG